MILLTILVVFLFLAAGEYKLFQDQAQIKNMVANGFLQVQQGLKVANDQAENVFMGFIIKNKTAKVLWSDGKVTDLKQDILLVDGSRLTVDGKLIRKDGTSITVSDGNEVGIDGTIIQR